MTCFQVPMHFEDLSLEAAGVHRVRLDSFKRLTCEQLVEERTFSTLYAAVSRIALLNQQECAAVADAVRMYALSSFEKEDVKRAVVLMAGLCNAPEGNGAGLKTQNVWDKLGRHALLEAMGRLLTTPGLSTWSPADRDEVVGTLLRLNLALLASPSIARDKAMRPGFARVTVLGICADPAQVVSVSTSMVHMLNRYEHVASPLAEVLVCCVRDEGSFTDDVTPASLNVSVSSDSSQHLTRAPEHRRVVSKLVLDVVSELTRLDHKQLARDTSSARSCATFLAELSDREPTVVIGSLSLLLEILEGESYVMRNGVVHVIGRLVQHLRNEESGEARDALIAVLMERSLRDINAFTRSKALQTWSSLAEERAIPHKRFVEVAEVASSRLEDKASAVRKSASQLLSCLLRCNPFGPSLRISHFRSKLEKELGHSHPQPNVGHRTHTTSVEEHAESEKEPNQRLVFYESCIRFIQAVESGFGKVFTMLRSTTVTDVSESVQLLVTAVQFQIEAASGRAVRAMLSLVLAREANIKMAAICAYEKLLAPDGVDSLQTKDGALGVANGLIALVMDSTLGELTCIECLVVELMHRETSIISHAVVAVMWDIFVAKVPNASEKQRCAACIYVGMFAVVRPETLESRVHLLETHMSAVVSQDASNTFRWICAALARQRPGSEVSLRLSNRIVQVIEAMSQASDADIGAVEQAINALFQLHPSPETAVAVMLRRIAAPIFENPSAVCSSKLAFVLFIVGHLAIKELVRVEQLAGHIRRSSAVQGAGGEEEAGLEADKALEFAEGEISSPPTLLGQYGKVAQQIVLDPSACQMVRASAVLCLAKLMCINAQMCQSNLQLLFTVLERALEASVRANAITALGDLAFRFPNLVEPWSARIYKALEDRDVRVRKNALMALTHLILNDMVKVKGQLVGLALRVLDDDERISEVARVFFCELARKSNNAIYNLLPDTISCLSRREDVSSEDFKTVVSFIISFIEKAWQSESVVDKLCHRFRTAENEKEARDLAYCISQLNITDRCVAKLADGFKLYSSYLVDDDVYRHLSAAITKARRSAASSSLHRSSGEEGNRDILSNDGEGSSATEKKHKIDELQERFEQQRRAQASPLSPRELNILRISATQ